MYKYKYIYIVFFLQGHPTVCPVCGQHLLGGIWYIYIYINKRINPGYIEVHMLNDFSLQSFVYKGWCIRNVPQRSCKCSHSGGSKMMLQNVNLRQKFSAFFRFSPLFLGKGIINALFGWFFGFQVCHLSQTPSGKSRGNSASECAVAPNAAG